DRLPSTRRHAGDATATAGSARRLPGVASRHADPPARPPPVPTGPASRPGIPGTDRTDPPLSRPAESCGCRNRRRRESVPGAQRRGHWIPTAAAGDTVATRAGFYRRATVPARHLSEGRRGTPATQIGPETENPWLPQ